MSLVKQHLNKVADLGCILCRHLDYGRTPPELHHPRDAAGGAQRASDWLVIPLCPEHHRGNSGLHGLGTNRNLVLLDGRRLPVSDINGNVDVNILPDAIISGVDAITGGASAQYGADAVGGVVNFVLDTKFVGFKGEIGGGISNYGDLPDWRGAFAWGGAFAGDKLHVVERWRLIEDGKKLEIMITVDDPGDALDIRRNVDPHAHPFAYGPAR